MKKQLFLILYFFATVALANTSRVEPAFWWTGMKNPNLQLLVYHPAIGEAMPSLKYSGVKIAKVNKVKSPNYLFIDIVVEPQAKAGVFPIRFLKNGKEVFVYQYELKNREPNAAQRKGFDASEVMYLIMPDRFANGDPTNDNVEGMVDKADRTGNDTRHGGDIEGIRQHLDYIAQMGFGSLWICPLLENNQNMGSYHGYAATDLYKVDPRFGTNESYKNLSKEARQKGLKMIFDFVPNHCGSEHWWMKDLPTDDWLNYQAKPQITHHARESIQDPHASNYDKQLHAQGWFVPSMPDLNQRNSFMANYLIQNLIWWIEYADLAGVRVDTYPYSDRDFMAQWSQRIMAEYPNLMMVGEEWSMSQALIAFWQRGKQNANGYVSAMPSMFDFPLQNALAEALKGNDRVYNQGLVKLYETLALDFVYPHPEDLVVMPDNHDMSRFYTQINENFDYWKMGMTFILTTRGIPQIYYGTEVLMTNPKSDRHDEIRTEMPGGWTDHTASAFSGKGLTSRQLEAQKYLTQLLQWRKTASAVHKGKLKHFAARDGLYVYFRYDGSQKVMVVLNKNKTQQTLDLTKFKEIIEGATKAKDIFKNQEITLDKALMVDAVSATILELK
jgi:neopullulanase